MVGIITIITITAIRVNHINTNQQVNLNHSEECIKNGSTEIVEENGVGIFSNISVVYN